ncbi:hypothetical protein BN7_461 [Wickerhamomyces ciferrii]|uniref:Uncharacterized protein n=1 Tax=Wickerhamomyces ciferrii (strain ATCC 14091 / BCRC 22168 / CBS 111 / JCM 3599 / NBRC 0793 / NRRL Y-1031 F-60-10) TaxID=1206466 RepID=K0KFC3_WICCF|nr:uncharacterized protein BN7_461 [Wickerhamomyces ciferrii]CCH40927.1 hypothetical protein BN7_461 [Wickerhamomyces ciferrii]
MVAHFSFIEAHRNLVTGLYKRIQTQLKNVDLERSLKRDMVDKVRHEFKIGKSYLSSEKAQKSLINAVKFEHNLKKFCLLGDLELLEPLKSSTSLEKFRLHSNTNREKQLNPKLHKNIRNLEPLEEQQTKNYITSFIRYKHKYGKLPLPKDIDPIMKEELIKPLALFKRAEFNIKIAEQKIARGPYNIRKTLHNDTTFLRTPWKQSHSLHKVTLSAVRAEQAYQDMRHLSTNPVEQALYEMEGDWEKLYGGDDKPWKQSLKTIANDQFKIVQSNRLYFKEFENFVLPIKMKQYQEISNQKHYKFRDRYLEMVEKVQESNAYDELLSKETLPSIVKRYRMETRKLKHKNT